MNTSGAAPPPSTCSPCIMMPKAVARSFRLAWVLLPTLLVLSWLFLWFAVVRRALGRKLGKRPMVDVHLIRI